MNTRILHLSDTHGAHHQLGDLPEADIIVHSGDFTYGGSEKEVVDFIEWFGSLPYTYKLFIAGNHDDYLFNAEIEGLPENCFYLCNSSVEIEGIAFHGVPMFMGDMVSGEYDNHVRQVPAGTGVLITHQPPYGILDFSGDVFYGDQGLLQTVLDVRPRYHLFGHIHDNYGVEEGSHTIFVNSSLVNAKYRLQNNPFVFDMP